MKRPLALMLLTLIAGGNASAQVPPPGQERAPAREHSIHNAHNFPLNAGMTENGMELRGVARTSPDSATWRSDDGLSVSRTNQPQGVVLSVSRSTTFREPDAVAAWRKCADTLAEQAAHLAIFHHGLVRSEAPRSDRPFDIAVILSEPMADPNDRRSIMLECVVQPERPEAILTISYRVSPAERGRALERQWVHRIADVVQRTHPRYRLGSGESGTLAMFRAYDCLFVFDASDANPQQNTGYFNFDLTRAGRIVASSADEVAVIAGAGSRSILTIDARSLAEADRIILTGLLQIIGRRCEAARSSRTAGEL